MTEMFKQVQEALKAFQGTYAGQMSALSAFQAFLQMSASPLDGEGTFTAAADEISREMTLLSQRLEAQAWTMKKATQVILPKQSFIASRELFAHVSWEEIGEFGSVVDAAINGKYEVRPMLREAKMQLEGIEHNAPALQAQAAELNRRLDWHAQQLEAMLSLCGGVRLAMDKEL